MSLPPPCLAIAVLLSAIGAVLPSGPNETGVEHWADIEPRCNGTHQSPVNLHEAVFDANLRHMHFEGYHDGEGTVFRLVNDGHSAKVYLPRLFYLIGGDLKGRYVADSLHFHWGKRNSQGSEHVIHGHRFPMEMHIVHYDDRYKNLADVEANGTSDALAVVAFLFEMSDTDNEYLQNIVNGLQHVRESEHDFIIAGFPLDNLLPNHHHYYYRYEGSLTVPSCVEKVMWNVFADTIPVSLKQLVQFRLLKDNRGLGLYDNFRPEQQLNDRLIITNIFNDSRYTYKNEPTTSQGGTKGISDATLLALLLAQAWFLLLI